MGAECLLGLCHMQGNPLEHFIRGLYHISVTILFEVARIEDLDGILPQINLHEQSVSLAIWNLHT